MALFFIAAAMLVASLAASFLPLMFKFSQKKLDFLTAFGAGLLTGTALIVIIPEGVHMWYDALNASTGHDEHEHHDHESTHSNAIGVAIAVGFVFMLILERLGAGHPHLHADEDIHTHSHGDSHPEPVQPAQNEEAAEEEEEEEQKEVAVKCDGHSSSGTFGTVVGLLIHAAVDGVALGAVSASGGDALQFLVFVAIMLHKVPAALGLTTFLLHLNLTQTERVKYIVYFALAAPVGALATAGVLSWDMIEYSPTAIAILLLFSAGTFLYVAAVHILPEVTQSLMGAYSGSLPWGFVLALAAGVLAPALMSFDHGH